MNEPSGFEMLMTAIDRRDAGAVAACLRRNGKLVRATDRAGFTPLLRSLLARPWNCGVIAALLDAGADPNAQLPDGYAALHCAVDVGAARRTRPHEVIALLVASGASLTLRQMHGWTPLLCAIVRGRVAETRALLDAGADPNDVFPLSSVPAFNAGRTALMAALTSRNPKPLLLALVAAGADPLGRDLHGMTLTEFAALLGGDLGTAISLSRSATSVAFSSAGTNDARRRLRFQSLARAALRRDMRAPA